MPRNTVSSELDIIWKYQIGLYSKRFCASLTRKLGREHKRGISRGRGRGQKETFPLFPSPLLPPPLIFHFLRSCSNFRLTTWLETVAKQASSKLFKFVINDSFSNKNTWNRQSTFWIALTWEAFTPWSCFRSCQSLPQEASAEASPSHSSRSLEALLENFALAFTILPATQARIA